MAHEIRVRIDTAMVAHNDGDPIELRPLLSELKKILYSHPEIKKLPRSSCKFY
jgi:hypothetical protein